MYLFRPFEKSALNQLAREKKQRFLGKENYQRFGNGFPLLVRHLRVSQCQLLQIRPSAEAMRRHGAFLGNAELWYAASGGQQQVREGDVFFMPVDCRDGLHADHRVGYRLLQDEGVQLATCPFFTTSIYDLDDPMTIDYSELDSFVLLNGLQGSAEVADDSGQRLLFLEGDALVVPASAKHIRVEGTIKFLETYI